MLLNAFDISKSIVSEHYKTNIDFFEGGLIKMEEGSVNKIHADNFKIDSFVSGRDGDGDGELCQYSAILYVSEQGSDFGGGYLNFPKHNLSISPEYGMLIFFPGDWRYMHEVTKVTSGFRYGIPMFMGYKK